MAKRRSFGSVRKLPSGRWQASYHHPISRERINGPHTFETKRVANDWLALQQADLLRGDDLDLSSRDLLFKVYAADWMATKIELRPKTVELYDMLLRVHILPTFGDYPLSKIDRKMVRRWHADRCDGRWASSTVAKMYRLLRQILQAAVDDRIARENPCRINGAATERSVERVPPTVDEVVRLADAIDPRYRAMVIVAAFVGLRRSECFGLARRHLDLDGPTIVVERQKVWTDADGFVFGPPKTHAGSRRLALPELVAAELRTHLDRYPTDDPDGLIFVDEYGHTPTPTVWRRRWNQARHAVGVGHRFHDLRHLAGTLNAQAGATVKEAMHRLGHSSPAAALRYQHAVDERDEEIADGVDDLIQNGGGRARSAHKPDEEDEEDE